MLHSQNNFPLSLIPLLLLLLSHSSLPEKIPKNSKWRKGAEQLRMLGLPGHPLNNLTSLSLNSYLALIFAER